MTEAAGWAGRVMVFLRVAAHVVAVNLLVVAGAVVGLVLAGLFPALASGGRLLARAVAGEPSEHLWRDFWSGYRAGFRRHALLGVPFWVVGALLAVDLAVVQVADGPVAGAMLAGLTLVGAWSAVALAHLFPVTRRSDDGLLATWRYVALAPLLSPLTGLAVLVTLAALAVVATQLTVLVPLAGLSLPLLLSGWLVDHRLDALDALDAADPAGPRSRSLG
ncbi:YesL family protein [Cellulomonas cellasea]|uniref:Putative membrane protein YesL n=1 Tax=Cellulomonas cellasea TaxID=43670 RepID=A0A7W4YB56_9CELL|nr:DUF624 domain-containing protein [Cellulomonas cellasea]MBB2922432.1 putative membrane protein YesL [Cellulomonas cellasea]